MFAEQIPRLPKTNKLSYESKRTTTFFDHNSTALSCRETAQMKIAQAINNRPAAQETMQLHKNLNGFGHLSNTGIVQMMPVDASDVGKRFKIRATDGTEGYAVLVAGSGGGWYKFLADDGSEINVRGQGNILASADAPADHPMDARSRLERAQERASDRGDLPALGTRVDAPTPFGMTGLSRQRYSPLEPQTTTRTGDFGGAPDPGPRYAQWLGKVGDIPAWSAMSSVVDSGGTVPPPSFSDIQNRAAAMVHGATHYSEPYRFRAAPKPARSAARLIGQGQYAPSQYSHLFPMAGEGGAHAYDEYLDGTLSLDSDQEQVLEDMSESSDDGN